MCFLEIGLSHQRKTENSEKILDEFSKSVKKMESYDDQRFWFWIRWSNVKLIFSWDTRIISNKNFQIRIDYFLNHTFKRNYQFEFREKYYRLIHGKRVQFFSPMTIFYICDYRGFENSDAVGQDFSGYFSGQQDKARSFLQSI